MSGRMVGEVLKYAPYDLRLLDRFVLVALAESAPDTDRTARHGVTQEELSDKLQAAEGSIRNALSRLAARGLIIPIFIHPRKGLAQNWRIPKMHEGTRKASLTDDPNNPPKGNHPMTQTPVENPNWTPVKASSQPLAKRHQGITPPGKTNSRKPVVLTQVPGNGQSA